MIRHKGAKWRNNEWLMGEVGDDVCGKVARLTPFPPLKNLQGLKFNDISGVLDRADGEIREACAGGMGKMVLWKGSEPRKPTTRKVGAEYIVMGRWGPVMRILSSGGADGELAARGRGGVERIDMPTDTLEPVGEEGMCDVDAEELEYGKGIIQNREKINSDGLMFADFLACFVGEALKVSASVSVSEGSDAVGLADVVVASVEGLTRRGGSPSWALLLVSDRVSSGVDVDGDRGIVDIVVRGNGSERQWAVMPMDVVAAVVGGNADGCSGSGMVTVMVAVAVVVVAVGTYRCSGAVTVAVVVVVVVVAIGTYRCSGAVAVTVVVVAVGTYGCSGAVAVVVAAVALTDVVVQCIGAVAVAVVEMAGAVAVAVMVVAVVILAVVVVTVAVVVILAVVAVTVEILGSGDAWDDEVRVDSMDTRDCVDISIYDVMTECFRL
ncbi:hypothetical protein BU17DRAFT_71583 [Hysterangium stoloniferum]|nr:hypothetical protein BU17DRAFT_71583 [Hysterangium stoloniferum]